MIYERLLKHWIDSADSRLLFNSFLEQETFGCIHVASHSSQSSITFPDTSLVEMRGSTVDLNGLHMIKIAKNAKLSRSGCSVINDRVISKESNEYVNKTMNHYKLFGKHKWMDKLSIHLCCY